MKTLLLALLMAASVAAVAGPPAPLATTIRAAKWKKRVLLLVAPTASQAAYVKQKQLLAADPTGLPERDLLVLDALGDHLSPADRRYVQRELRESPASFAVVLIGKDGGVKERSTRPLAPAALFGTIDKMPMRRQEMQRH